MEGLLPFVYKSLRKNKIRRKYECLSSGAAESYNILDFYHSEDACHRPRDVMILQPEPAKVPGSRHRRYNSVHVDHHVKSTSASHEFEDLYRGCDKPKQLVRFRSHRMFSCINDLQKSLALCSPYCFYYNKPTSFAAAPAAHSLRLGFEFPIEKPRKKDNILHTLAVRQLTGSLTSAEGLRFAIVVARFNEIVTKPLLEGALKTFGQYSVKEEDIDVVWVPGSFEIGVVAEKLGKSQKYQAIVCIGAVIRGDTSHYDAVANSAASGVLSAGLNSGVPCIFGVLTCESMEQALNRAGGKSGNKGAEAALTAIEMASLFEHHFKL